MSFSYASKLLLSAISFSVEEGQTVALVGRSGCGKTTLLRLIGGLSLPTSGTINLQRPVSYMMQHALLLPWRTVMENLLLPFELGKHKNLPREAARACLEEVGLSHAEKLYPDELSGGMQSRVALARVLLENKPILLLDEPFAFLDAITRAEMQRLLIKLQRKYCKTIVLVTHDLQEAIEMSDRILLLAGGRITQSWDVHSTPDLHSSLLHKLSIH